MSMRRRSLELDLLSDLAGWAWERWGKQCFGCGHSLPKYQDSEWNPDEVRLGHRNMTVKCTSRTLDQDDLVLLQWWRGSWDKCSNVGGCIPPGFIEMLVKRQRCDGSHVTTLLKPTHADPEALARWQMPSSTSIWITEFMQIPLQPGQWDFFIHVNGPGEDDCCFTSSLIYPCLGIAVGLLESHEKIQGSLSNGLWPSKRSALSSWPLYF